MKYKNKKGYTLVECLLTMLLAIILLTLGVASYHYLIAQNKATIYSNQLITTLNYARSEALKQHIPITICKSNDGQQCKGEWQDGWIIFTDPLNKAQPDHNNQILRIYQALPKGDRLIWRSSLHKNAFIQFNTFGNIRQAGTFIYCPHNSPEQASAIVVSLTGRVRIEHGEVDSMVCTQG